jgi:hypothetical protein
MLTELPFIFLSLPSKLTHLVLKATLQFSNGQCFTCPADFILVASSFLLALPSHRCFVNDSDDSLWAWHEAPCVACSKCRHLPRTLPCLMVSACCCLPIFHLHFNCCVICWSCVLPAVQKETLSTEPVKTVFMNILNTPNFLQISLKYGYVSKLLICLL